MNGVGNEILLVEDDASDSELAAYVLNKHFPEVGIQLLRDGPEALEYLSRADLSNGCEGMHCPRVILLDWKLPRVGGSGVLRRIKSDLRTQNIPVVVLTSSCEDNDIEEAYRCGSNSYVVKPVDFQRFSDTLCHVARYWLRFNEAPWAARRRETVR